MKVLLAGGGTAGHTSPLLATADALRRLAPETEVTCLGTARGLETRVVPEAGYPLELIPPVPLPRRITGELFRVPANLRRSVKAAGEVIDRTGAEVVVGFGGYVSLPAYFAARRRRLPIVIHEQNALPGLANKIGARFAAKRGAVAVSFPGTPLPAAQYVGLPIRRMISTLDRAASRPEGLAAFGLDPAKPTLVVTGGSQGAVRINEAITAAAPSLIEQGAQILHVIGPKNEPALTMEGYHPEKFVTRMDLALAVADLMVCRSGASSVVEAAATGVPAVFVPLAIGNGEQARNAAPVVEAGGALLVDNAAFTADWVKTHVGPLLHSPEQLAAMGAAASHLIPSDADEQLARIILGMKR
ncbi:undecaprenyldiphospho-muramoylpentapeptide beta-N-acetylglucosaminyltransferase [Nocardioides sp. Kera G14]|uniref:undecaprenyldiphospho-muramoylpentapeptide beta-N-acetylglucosaminyltransferase n=1 Tax=Nocardioides sp. Kera G14 TaxID=2884264 RepID=UPI001D114624|nr:undecaprenyldiphospho-muramoylpentapeptide beta-N-acetylglucosaminyltransferase [Nocardioides sp. Kera G14]UDY22487.1 undecaprenyldiphospho-muramoylpentapeptide beta-N-acetylglucosaminyltransferase [Nocardioides sp. Kera G14]